MNLNKIKLKTVEEFRSDQANNCLPKDVRCMIIGGQPIFVKWHKLSQKWMPVAAALQKTLEKKHIIKE